jgi:DNA-directed RNA polymerase specialized sigma24 family protein
MPACPISADEFGLLLHGFQAGDPESSEQFVTATFLTLQRLTHQYSRNLPDDLQKEIVQEALLRLLRRCLAPFDASRGTIQEYLVGVVWNAKQQVLKNYGVKQSRNAKKAATSPAPEPMTVSLDEVPQRLLVENPEFSLHNKIAVEQILAQASSTLRLVLERLCFAEESLTHIAASLGMDRFALRRRIVMFSRSFVEI